MTAAPHDTSESVLPSPLLLVEDELLMQVRLRTILLKLGYGDQEISVVGSLAQARAILTEQPFAMTMIDIGLPDGSGIDLIHELHARDPALPILVVSAWSTEQVIVQALQAGATGYVLKERDDVEIAASVRSALRGGAPIDPFVARHILGLVRAMEVRANDQSAPPLSPRETEILGLVAKGLTNREIATLLFLSPLTVACHIRNIYKKLAVSSRTQAVFEARTHGLLP
ncbi:response regulator transcription factor [Paraburkholderia tropica]|uniref:response regulator transcription factor n=1 Tax=Paraburkholderia tropica TaxID=92647 RepID=UPI002AAFBD5B|nr:response regulator transcription factor [Paraburkholderia tropica]